MTPMIKTVFCWWPRRLVRFIQSDTLASNPKMEFAGWVWLQRATLYNNVNHGWIAFLD